MDTVLEQALEIAYLIRDSEEAILWRKAWNSLLHIESRARNIQEVSLEAIPLVERIKHLRISDLGISRPLMFPLLVAYFPLEVNIAQSYEELKSYPEVLEAYRSLVGSLGLVCSLVTFLRSIGSGYPHASLIYTVPGTPWARLSNMKELPWNLGELFDPMGATDARYIGLHRFIPSVSHEVAAGLNDLVTAIKSDNAWRELERSYAAVRQRGNLWKELGQARVQFQRSLDRINQTRMPKVLWEAKVEEEAKKTYSKRGPRIQTYVQSFLDYEWLIERLYWIASQVVMYENISRLTSSEPHQLQQVNISYGQNALLTALAPTLARTLQIGQLVHLQLTETGGTADGIYQVDKWVQRYEVSKGECILFRARSLWYWPLDELLIATKESINRVFVPSEEKDVLGDTWVTIGSADELALTGRIKDLFLSSELVRTMYLP